MTAVNGTFEFAHRVEPPEESGASRRQQRIESFHPSCCRLVGDMAASSAALGDLADSFPGLLFALATGYATAAERKRAFDLLGAGAPLREVADALGLAWWLRKLPPQAFVGPLSPLPADPDFAVRITNLIPSEPLLTPTWLARVSHGHEACGTPYALWLARQPDLHAVSEDMSMLMAAWAWFSERSGLLGTRLLRRPWACDMSFKRAREEMALWRQRLRLIECLGPGIETPWLADGTAAGFSFVALRTVDDFVAESNALDNCLDQYADQLHTGLTAVFSVRRGLRSVACVEIGLHEAEVTMPTIVQLRAARNRRAPPEVWQAAYAWLGTQRLEPLSPERHTPRRTKRAEARRQLWSPYLAFLAGTRHEDPFRRLVLERSNGSRQAGGERRAPRRRAGGLQLRLQTSVERVGALEPGAVLTPGRPRPQV